MSILSFLYIDDQLETNEIKRIVRILNSNKAVATCKVEGPPSFEEIPSLFCDMLFTDHDLAGAAPQSEPAPYHGTTLATEYREHHRNTPIVMLTRKDFFEGDRQRFIPQTANTPMDLVIFKDELMSDFEAYLPRVFSLAKGFQALQEIESQGWKEITDLMQAEPDESRSLKEANPPIKQLNGLGQNNNLVHSAWLVTDIAEWIRSVIMEYPGILINELHAATRLGIDVEEFNSNPILQEIFEPALYKGIFHEFGKRWWTRRLLKIGTKVLMKNEVDTYLNEGFREAFYQEHGQNLKPAICVSDETSTADAVCYVLNKPVKYINSIPYYPDSRPSIMEKARISRKAIATTNRYIEDFIDIDSLNIAREWKVK